ncbi:helix-turn-helix domain-containing protein [Streptomyces sp. NPDC048416]|uniref:helix-turn-helix domain-containing protein n=1 Tax=Streptomyces sp. NPDC048416 TaxID=3365546 RepID=UPI00371C5E65
MATTESEQFAALLRELKDRSGRSYGVLAGRLHMSTSTLHRYCNGDAVPNEYAPVERLARLCGASPEESVELHRRWILADEARRRSRAAGQTPAAAEAAPRVPEPGPGPGPGAAAPGPSPVPGPGLAPGPDAARHAGPGAGPSAASAGESTAGGPTGSAGRAPDAESGDGELPAVGPVVPAPGAGRRGLGGLVPRRLPGKPGKLGKRTRLVLIGAAVVAVAVPVTAVATLSGGPAGSDTVADARTSSPPAGAGASPSVRTSVGPSAGASRSPSGSPSASLAPDAASPSGAAAPKGEKKHVPAGSAPVGVGISSYDWDTPCGKFYLLDQKPGAVPPPPNNVQDRRSWARALNGVDGGNLKLELTATGKSQQSVVITGITVRVVGRQAPLGWTAYSMGSGCGGGVVPQSFDIDLDAAQPVSKPVAGHQGDDKVPARDFPFKVSTSDPEVFDLNVHTEAHDVSWYLEVSWSDGDRSDKIRVDDNGKPFRTSATKGRPAYEYRLDTNVWDHLDIG